MSPDPKAPRALKLSVRRLLKPEALRDARRKGYVACDAVMMVELYREANEQEHRRIGSFDAATGGQLTVDQLFNIWLDLAGEIARTPVDADTPVTTAAAQRFARMVLLQLKLTEDLARAPTVPAPAPDPAKA